MATTTKAPAKAPATKASTAKASPTPAKATRSPRATKAAPAPVTTAQVPLTWGTAKGLGLASGDRLLFGDRTAGKAQPGQPGTITVTRTAVNVLLDNGGSDQFGVAGKFWAAKLATPSKAAKAQPAKAQPAKAQPAKAAKAPAQASQPSPHEDRMGVEVANGYVIRWPHASWDAAKAGPNTPAGSPTWLIICNEHGTTTTTEGSDRRYLGSAEGRTTWCAACKAKAAKAAK